MKESGQPPSAFLWDLPRTKRWRKRCVYTRNRTRNERYVCKMGNGNGNVNVNVSECVSSLDSRIEAISRISHLPSPREMREIASIRRIPDPGSDFWFLAKTMLMLMCRCWESCCRLPPVISDLVSGSEPRENEPGPRHTTHQTLRTGVARFSPWLMRHSSSAQKFLHEAQTMAPWVPFTKHPTYSELWHVLCSCSSSANHFPAINRHSSTFLSSVAIVRLFILPYIGSSIATMSSFSSIVSRFQPDCTGFSLKSVVVF